MNLLCRVPSNISLPTQIKANIRLTETQVVDRVRGVSLPSRLDHLARKQTQREAQLLRRARQNLRLQLLGPAPRSPGPALPRPQLLVLGGHPLAPGVDSVRVLEPHRRVVYGGTPHHAGPGPTPQGRAVSCGPPCIQAGLLGRVAPRRVNDCTLSGQNERVDRWDWETTRGATWFNKTRGDIASDNMRDDISNNKLFYNFKQTNNKLYYLGIYYCDSVFLPIFVNT